MTSRKSRIPCPGVIRYIFPPTLPFTDSYTIRRGFAHGNPVTYGPANPLAIGLVQHPASWPITSLASRAALRRAFHLFLRIVFWRASDRANWPIPCLSSIQAYLLAYYQIKGGTSCRVDSPATSLVTTSDWGVDRDARETQDASFGLTGMEPRLICTRCRTPDIRGAKATRHACACFLIALLFVICLASVSSAQAVPLQHDVEIRVTSPRTIEPTGLVPVTIKLTNLGDTAAVVPRLDVSTRPSGYADFGLNMGIGVGRNVTIHLNPWICPPGSEETCTAWITYPEDMNHHNDTDVVIVNSLWQRTYGGAEEDAAASVRQTRDGGFVIAGYTGAYNTEKWFDAYLVRTNATGDTLWTRRYGGSEAEEASCVQQTTDGGYIMVGYTYTYGPGAPGFYANVYLIKTDSLGDTLWTRAYGRSDEDDRGLSVAQTSDGGYVAVGWSICPDEGWMNLYLVRTDSQGDTLWTRTYDGPGYDQGASIKETSDSCYIIAGRTTDAGGSSSIVWLMKANAQGDTLWTRAYGRTGWDVGSSVLQTTDGGYLIAGSSDKAPGGDRDVYLVKTNAQGDTLWTRAYGGTDNEWGMSAEQTSDGGYVVTGYTYSLGLAIPYRANDAYLIRTDARGDSLWTRTYGGTGDDRGNSVQPTADGGCIVAGATYSFGAGGYDFYVIRTRGELDIGPVAIQSPTGAAESGSAYVPRAVIRNFGLTSGIIPVTMEIGLDYARTVKETLASVPFDTVEFPKWTAGPIGTVPVKCFTWMAGDQDRANDTIASSIQVGRPPRHDVGTVAIISPSGGLRPGDAVIPKARVRNFGSTQERFFDVRFRIGTGYDEKVDVTNVLPPDSTVYLTFPPWVAEAGDWSVSCSTMLASDADSDNDKASSSVQVSPQTLVIGPDQADRVEAGQRRTYRFHVLIAGDTGGVVAVARPTALTGWGLRLCDATGEGDLTDTDSDGVPDLGYLAPSESGRFSVEVTAPSATEGDTSSLGHGAFIVAGHVGGRVDVADTATLTLTLVPEFSVHNFPNPFTDQTAFVVGLPEDGKASLTVYTRAGERVCRVIQNTDFAAGVHFVPWSGVNDNGRTIAPGTYEYLLDYVHAGKADRIRKRLVVTKE